LYGEILFEYILIGGGFAFAAAIQPGPLQAYLLSSVLQRGWRHTLPASIAPLISDGPIVLVALLVLSRVPESFQTILRVAGGLLLLYFAWRGYQHWRIGVLQGAEQVDSTPRTLLQAVMVNLLNPNPYLAWSLVLGPAVVDAWQNNHNYAVVMVVTFYTVIVIGTAGIIYLFGRTSMLGPRGQRALMLISAGILAFLGVYQLVVSLINLGIV
jgi:threonine/homoserine/homoserine lactone efflux protein